jgi:hypothetical protein
MLMVALMNWAGMLFILQGHMNYAQMLQVYNLVLFSLTFGTALLDFSESFFISDDDKMADGSPSIVESQDRSIRFRSTL